MPSSCNHTTITEKGTTHNQVHTKFSSNDALIVDRYTHRFPRQTDTQAQVNSARLIIRYPNIQTTAITVNCRITLSLFKSADPPSNHQKKSQLVSWLLNELQF